MKYDELVKVMNHVIIMPATKDHFPLDKSWETKKWSVFGEEEPTYTDDEVYGAEVLEIAPKDFMYGDAVFRKNKLYAILNLK